MKQLADKMKFLHRKFFFFGVCFLIVLSILYLFFIHPSKKELKNEQIIEEILAKMTIDEKIGQLLMINYYSDQFKSDEELEKWFHKYPFGGVIHYQSNVSFKSKTDIKLQNKILQKINLNIPIFIAIDQEGGSVARLKKDILPEYPDMKEWYAKKGMKGVQDIATTYAKGLYQLGYNVNFAPVLDTIYNDKSVIARRGFTSDPYENAKIGAEFLKIYDDYSMILALKHYPGYGRGVLDPHFDIIVDKTSNLNVEDTAFIENLDAPMIMTAHVFYPHIDSEVATFSKKILSHLRDKGYENILITDDIRMKGITLQYDYKEAALLAILAGNDIVVSAVIDDAKFSSKRIQEKLFLYLKDAYHKGTLSSDRIDESVRRILKIKLEYLSNYDWKILKR